MFIVNLFQGGTLGVFCGASFLSFLEIFVWIAKFFLALVSSRKSGKKIKSKNNEMKTTTAFVSY